MAAVPGTSRAFWDALYAADVDVITELLEAEDVTLDAGDPECGMETPLMRLCHTEMDHEDLAAILELMLLKGPDVNVRDCEGRSVLCHACMSGQTHVIRRLSTVPHCDPNLPDCYGNTALMFGVYYGDVNVIQILLTSFTGNGPGVDIPARNNEGITATMIAEQNQYHEIADYLQQYLSWTLSLPQTSENHTEQTQQDQSATAEDSPEHVGSRVRNFRRQKLRHALGPLVVQNKLQTSKSADYSRYYHGHGGPEESPRQQSYSAGAQASNSRITDKLYRQTTALVQQQYTYDEDEFEDSSDEKSDQSDDDDVYDENEDPRGAQSRPGRRGSNSLPDLRNDSKHGALVAIHQDKAKGGHEGYCDSGYDTRSSQCTVSREELLLPNLPEGGFMGEDEDDYTPRTRRGSFSLPDLRGLKRDLVANNNVTSSPRLLELGSNSSTPRRARLGSNASTPDLRLRGSRDSLTRRGEHLGPNLLQDDLKYIHDFIKSDYEGDDDSSASDGAAECEETLKFSDVRTPRDIGLKLPMLGDINSVVNTPRVITLPEIGSGPKHTPIGGNLRDNKNKLTKRTPKEHVTPQNIATHLRKKAHNKDNPQSSRGTILPQSPRISSRSDINNTLQSPQTTRKPKPKVLLDPT